MDTSKRAKRQRSGHLVYLIHQKHDTTLATADVCRAFSNMGKALNFCSSADVPENSHYSIQRLVIE